MNPTNRRIPTKSDGLVDPLLIQVLKPFGGSSIVYDTGYPSDKTNWLTGYSYALKMKCKTLDK